MNIIKSLREGDIYFSESYDKNFSIMIIEKIRELSISRSLLIINTMENELIIYENDDVYIEELPSLLTLRKKVDDVYEKRECIRQIMSCSKVSKHIIK